MAAWRKYLRPPALLFSGALLLLVICACYGNALWGVFQFDDYNVIVNNPRIHSWPAWWKDTSHGIRPLLKFTYTLDWTLGLGALGFHLTNVLIHLCNTLLVLVLSRRFAATHAQLQHQPYAPLLAALLFAVHPIHTEAVTYICGRSIALMTLFYLAGMLAYMAGRARENWLLLHVITPASMVLALAVKETAVTFPLALLVCELYGGGTLKSALRRQWSSWALLLVAAMFFLLHGGYQAQMETSAGLNSVQGNMATQSLVFSYLLRQWLFPLWLNIDPDLRVARDFAGLWPQMMLVVAVFALMLLTFRRRPWLSFALAWAMLQLLPLYWFLPRVDVANDRQLYLLGWPLAFALIAELSLWLKPRVFMVTVVLLLLILAGLTMMRNQVYQSEVALWEATVPLSPDKARVHNNLGYAYMLAGRVGDARVEFVTALQLDPGYYQARFNLLRLEQQGR